MTKTSDFWLKIETVKTEDLEVGDGIIVGFVLYKIRFVKAYEKLDRVVVAADRWTIRPNLQSSVELVLPYGDLIEINVE